MDSIIKLSTCGPNKLLDERFLTLTKKVEKINRAQEYNKIVKGNFNPHLPFSLYEGFGMTQNRVDNFGSH